MLKNFSNRIVLLIILWILFPGCTPRYHDEDKSPRGLFARGERALKEHRLNEAHFLYSEIMDKYPECEYADDALYKKGYLEVYLSEYSDANKSFEKLMKEYPDSRWRFDASLWEGLLGELAAYKKVEARSVSLEPVEKSVGEMQKKIEHLEVENEELRRQIQKLRQLLQE